MHPRHELDPSFLYFETVLLSGPARSDIHLIAQADLELEILRLPEPK